MFDIKSLIADANIALEAVQRLAPMAAALNIPYISPAAGLASKLSEVARAALDQADSLNIAITSEDQAQLTALIAKLDVLAAEAEAEADAAEKAALA